MSEQTPKLPPRQNTSPPSDLVGLLIVGAAVALMLYAVLNCKGPAKCQ